MIAKIINGTVVSTYTNLNNAVNSIPSPMVEDITLEVRTNNNITGVNIRLVNDSHILTIQNGEGYTGRITTNGISGINIIYGSNIIMRNLRFIDIGNSASSPIRLGNGIRTNISNSILIENCEITGRRGLWADFANNIIYRNNTVFATYGLMYVNYCNSISISNITYTINDIENSESNLIEIHKTNFLKIHDQIFPELSYFTYAIRLYDCDTVDITRCKFENSYNYLTSIAESINTTIQANDSALAVNNLTIDSCIFNRDRRSMALYDINNLIIKNNTFISDGWFGGYQTTYCVRTNKVWFINNIMQLVPGTASTVSYYSLNLNAASIINDYVVDYNTYYAPTTITNHTFGDVSDWSGARTFSDFSELQAYGLETHSYEESTSFINSTSFLVDILCSASTSAIVDYIPYMDFNKNIRPVSNQDRGAVDNNSSLYVNIPVNTSIHAYNKTQYVYGSITDTMYAVAKYDETFLIADYNSYISDAFWNLSDGTNSYIIFGENAYIKPLIQGTFNVSLHLKNLTDYYQFDYNDYYVVEKPRPIANFHIDFVDSPLYINQSFNLINDSQYHENSLWEIETAPTSGLYDAYTGGSVTNISKSIPGQYNVRLSVSNSDVYTGIRNNILFGIKHLGIADINLNPIFDIECNEITRLNQYVQFTVNIKNNVNVASYEWRFKGTKTKTSTSASPVIQYTKMGAFDVALKITTDTGHSNWIYKRRLVTVTNSLENRRVHIVNLADLPGDSGPPNRSSYKILLDNYSIGAEPGDLVYLRGSVRQYSGLTIKGFHGASNNPIIIGNYPGEVAEINYNNNVSIYNTAFYTKDCQHIVFDFKIGNLSNDFYGLKITALQSLSNSLDGGVKLYEWSSDIEIFGINIVSCGFPGFQAKTEPTIANVANPRWATFKFSNLIIHHCKIDECRGEGFYLGFNNIIVQESGSRPHVMENGRIYRNIISNTQKDGFQYGNATGLWEIHDNTFYNTATLDEGSHNSCMSINTPRAGCKTWIYNNYFDGYPGIGLSVWVAKEMYIFNNVFIGQKTLDRVVYMHNDCEENGDRFVIANNTFDGLYDHMYFNVGKTAFPSGSIQINNFYVVNNIHILADSKEISEENGNLSLLSLVDDNQMNGYEGQSITTNILNYTVSNNLFVGRRNINKLFFNDHSKKDLRIQPGSIASTSGLYIDSNIIPLSDIGLEAYDLEGFMKPLNNNLYSIGAYGLSTSVSNSEVLPHIGFKPTIILQHNNSVIGKKNCGFHNFNGCDIYQNDINNNKKIYIPIDSQGIPIITSKLGYTKIQEWRPNNNIFPILDANIILDNAELDISNIASDTRNGITLYAQPVYDSGNLIGYSKLRLISYT